MAIEKTNYNSTDHWAKEFASAKKWFQRWHTSARKIEKSYLLAQDSGATSGGGEMTGEVFARYNLFWSNVQTLLSAMYGRIPAVQVDRTHLDPNDDVARVAGLILERIFNFEYTNIEDSPYYTYQECIQDRLVAGMGIAWARYAFTEDVTTLEVPGGDAVNIPIITDEMAPVDYVNWEDFSYSPCKRWQDKRWVARRVPMAQEEVATRFGDEKAESIPYDLKSTSKYSTSEDPTRATTENMANIWEIWCQASKSVYWYVPGCSEMLDAKEDPLKLKGFWPCKRPMVATLLSKAFMPRPDFLYAQSQYAELNLISARCQLLTEALKVVGVYDDTNEGIQRMLNQASMNQLIPVGNWAMFAEKGGLKGAVDWFPLEMVVNTLMQLTQRKSVLVGEVYEILGISDIQRGQAATRETATTQRLKAQFGSVRSDKTSQEVARFITDCTRLRAEIICLHWQAQTILDRSQIMQTADREIAPAAVKMLKTDPSIVARLTVAADTIAAPDWDLEKQQRIDFLQAISQFIGMAMPIIQTNPGAAPFMIQIMQWAATGFKGAKQIEGVLDQALAAMQKDLTTPKPPKPPTPEDQKDLASASKSVADARKTNIEAMGMLAQGGVNPQALQAVPPHIPGMTVPMQGAQPQGQPPQGQGAVPPANIPPQVPRPRPVR